jgi:hypothetical protein
LLNKIEAIETVLLFIKKNGFFDGNEGDIDWGDFIKVNNGRDDRASDRAAEEEENIKEDKKEQF